MTEQAKFLLSGHDTAECAYYLAPGKNCEIDYAALAYQKEKLRYDKSRTPKVIKLGGIDFLLQPYGSSSGYSYVIENSDYVISFGEFMKPSFFVKYKCLALWQKGLDTLHAEFMEWAESIGLYAYHAESLSRVDFSFDFEIPERDFDENSFISMAKKDSRYRNNRVAQTFQFGKGDIVLRVYDKIAEIKEESNKTWFYDLWETEQNVWRIEWQCRKPILKRFELLTVDDLFHGQGDMLHYLASEHDSLRVPNNDKNRSRWPLHPLWLNLQAQIKNMACLGVYRAIDNEARLETRITRIAISMLGYAKQMAAIDCVKHNKPMVKCEAVIEQLATKIMQVHDPFTWRVDVEKKINKIRLGQ